MKNIKQGTWTKKMFQEFISKFKDDDEIAMAEVKNDYLFIGMTFKTNNIPEN